MVRQCAWCLCLINEAGRRVSPTPLPKLYEATHGICSVCGIVWMEQALTQAANPQKAKGNEEVGEEVVCEMPVSRRQVILALPEPMLQLQQESEIEHSDGEHRGPVKIR
jgi:hypothetical protein